jgi:N-acyl-phosphatidylethanolamine-hydrolysing phospholipase D
LFPNQGTFYFGGDTALPTDFPLFEQMSDYLAAPIDLAALPIGAYAPEFFMRDAHMSPSEAVRVHDALQVKKSIGIHWGCFPLSEEPMDEPPLLLRAAAGEKDYTVWRNSQRALFG